MRGALLWKRILNEGVMCSASPEVLPEHLTALQNRIITAPIIVDSRPKDDLAEEGMPWRWKDFKRNAMPFDEFWVEGSTVQGQLYGCLLKWWSIQKHGTIYEGDPPPAEAEYQVLMNFVGTPSKIEGIPTTPGWVGSCSVFLDIGRDLIVSDLESQRLHCVVPSVITRYMEQRRIFQSMATHVDNVFDLLEMLNCKNVSLKANDPDPDQVRRAEKRFGSNASGYRYHTLVVRPAGSKPGTPGQDIGVMPRHICRGHFAEYGPEFGKGLLFGKYAGRFYVPPHMKGDKKNGVVEKDYAITAVNQ